ncbi:helix-turn-helix transcriptional regulator [Bacillus sp. FSL W7-1360]
MGILSKKLKMLRENKGWSKALTMRKLHLNALSTYANWEYDKANPSPEMLVQIADLYDVSVDYLLGRVDDPKDRVHKVLSKHAESLEALTEDEIEHILAELQRYREIKKKFSKT